MMEIANNSLFALSDAALVNMPSYIWYQRLMQNQAQEEISELAGYPLLNPGKIVKQPRWKSHIYVTASPGFTEASCA
jgi:hypothetical protein